MIEGLKPYPEYKDSGLKWASAVPSHWKTPPAFAVYTPMNERNFGLKEKTVLSLSYGRIIIKPIEKLRGLVPESFETYQILNPGDIVLRTTDLQNDHTSLRAGLVKNRGIITSAYLGLSVKKDVIPEFGYQFLHVWDTSKAIYEYGSGLRQNLDFYHFKRMPVPLPPPEEQAAIVRFLSYANQQIESTIRSKKKLIALLNEQKQAIIHRAVTRGLHPNVPMRDSGIPWLGQIPAHWSLIPNRTFLRIRKVLVGERHKEYKVLSLTKNGVIVRNMESGGKFSSFWDRSQEVRPGDFVFCLFDVEETPRTVGRSQYLGMISGDYTVMECSDEPTAAFVECFYKAMDDRKLLSPLYSGLRKRIPKPEFLSVATPIPPRDEQIAIVRSIEASLLGLEQSAEQTHLEISLLREFRTRLVADVVTGQLDVREAARSLPDLSLEPSPALTSDEDTDEINDEETTEVE